MWNTHVTSPNKFTTWDVQIPGNVDKICITKGKYNSYGNNTEKSIARGGTTTYDCDINFTITFQTNGILHVVSPYKTLFPLELFIDGYHYPTLADLLTQVTAVESSVTDLQVACASCTKKRRKIDGENLCSPDPQGYQDAGRGARPSAQHRESLLAEKE